MMPVFTIQAPDGRKIKIDAADEQTAVRGAQEWAASNPVEQQPRPSPVDANGVAQPPADLRPGTREYADWAAQNARAGNKLPQVSNRTIANMSANPDGSLAKGNAIVPLAQGMSMGWGDEMASAAHAAGDALQGRDFGQSYDENMRRYQAMLDYERETNPVGSVAAEIGGAVAPAVLTGGASILPQGGNLLSRALMGGVAGMGHGLVYSMGASEADSAQGRVVDGATGALMGGGIGAAIPVVGAAISAGAKAVSNKVGPMINSAINPEGEAARRLGTAYMRDAQANPQSVMGQADEAMARQSGIPLMNVDRGGETVRALARSTANQSPEARQVITKAADDRFETQGLRAIDFIKTLTGGQADDLTYQQAIKDTAKLVNTPRYKAAWEAPGAQAVWSPQIRQLMQSPQFLQAVRMAETRGADKAAISGFKAVKNPFTFGPNGTIGLRTNPDGSKALPSLQFWNQVKINLDGMIERAQRGAKPDRGLYADLTQMKQMLVRELDAAVPQYKTARQGAAAFFDADDALEAGKKFANQPRNVPEAKRAFGSFNDAEKQAFQTGYASELIDKIRSTRDRVNVINQVFGNQSSREMIELVFGPAKARQLEAYVRVENLADMIRGALGNSTTARQLVELGIGGGAGFALSGDWQGALTGAALARGGRWAGQKVDAKVMELLAKKLTSRNPADLQAAIANATMSQQWMKALDALERALEAPTRGGFISAVNQ